MADLSFELGNRQDICFWKDKQSEGGRLKDMEPMAYNIAIGPDNSVKHNYSRVRYRLKLGRINNQQRRAQNTHMREITSQLIRPSDNKDRPLWVCDSNELFSVSSCYRIINMKMENTCKEIIQKIRIPTKMVIFRSLINHKVILT